jgi:phosphopantothenoylcysteine decarboxylase/phosphopantothenate--cysteine ligase
MRVVLGVTGGVASYKACEIVRRLKERGMDVWVVPTKPALNFVGEATWAALSGNPVHTDLWAETHRVPHIELANSADLVLIAPATANTMARLTYGMADDMLSSVVLATKAPVVLAPAMHTEMWLNPATQANVATLRSRGVTVIDPAEGALTSGDSGLGRLPEPSEIVASVEMISSLGGKKLGLTGKSVLITAGGTREAIDPVRFVGNSSSGLQGVALARIAALAGAKVTLVGANIAAAPPAGCAFVPVVSAQEMAEEVWGRMTDADLIVCAAAVADFTPTVTATTKIKRANQESLAIELKPAIDVLAGVIERRRPDQSVIGFAAETASSQDQLVALGAEKLAAKGCDLLVLNAVDAQAPFGRADNEVFLLSPRVGPVFVPLASKNRVAVEIYSAWARTTGTSATGTSPSGSPTGSEPSHAESER